MTSLLTATPEPSSAHLYQHLEDGCNIHVISTSPDRTRVVIDDHWDFSRLAIIDGFVQKTLETDQPGYVATTGSNGRVVWGRRPWVEPFYQSVTSGISPLMQERFDVRNVFVDLFLHACTELKILDWTSYVSTQGGTMREAGAVAFNNLIVAIRRLAKQQPYPSKIWHAHNDWQTNRDSCFAFVASLFSERSRFAVVRVDLAYRKEHAYEVFTADARADMARLLKHMRRSKKLKKQCQERDPFGDLAGYIWKLEYGADRLLHFHCFFFFKEKNGRQAGYWAQEIGKYWVEVVTEGRGTIHNCNFDWYGHPDEGIGEVNRKDSAKMENLRRALAV